MPTSDELDQLLSAVTVTSWVTPQLNSAGTEEWLVKVLVLRAIGFEVSETILALTTDSVACTCGQL
ncbi:hypothetical protein D3C87_2087920 [compost metagenome]